MALPTEQMLSIRQGGFALRRIGQLKLLTCLRKAVSLAFEDVLSFGLVRNFVSLACTLLEGDNVLNTPLYHHDVNCG